MEKEGLNGRDRRNPEVESEMHPSRKRTPMVVTDVNPEVSKDESEMHPSRKLFFFFVLLFFRSSSGVGDRGLGQQCFDCFFEETRCSWVAQ